jgi:hypothetical protein
LEKEIYTKIRSVLGRKIFVKGRERERERNFTTTSRELNLKLKSVG